MTKTTIFPLGNADAILIQTKSEKLILVDFGNMFSGEEEDLRVDLAEELSGILKNLDRDSIDVVAFTHLDKDHYKGFSEFFYLEHATKYQSEERVKIDEMWVPAAILVETGNDIDSEGVILRTEARHRVKEDKAIKIFSKPELLNDWLEENDMTLESRLHMIADAGQLLDAFTLEEDGIEIFPHSPFAADLDDEPGYEINRNDSSLILHITFIVEEGRDLKLILGSDAASGVWDDIVKVTEHHGNENRLEWDVFKLSHHCSYRSLNENKEAWEESHKPTENVAKLFETYARTGCLIVSTSDPIDSNEDSDQPPHKEAADYYDSVAKDKEGNFIVTMEHPSSESPEILEIEITETGYEISKKFKISTTFIKSQSGQGHNPKGLWGEL